MINKFKISTTKTSFGFWISVIVICHLEFPIIGYATAPSSKKLRSQAGTVNLPSTVLPAPCSLRRACSLNPITASYKEKSTGRLSATRNPSRVGIILPPSTLTNPDPVKSLRSFSV